MSAGGWNRGRTKETDATVARIAAASSERWKKYWASLTPEQRKARTEGMRRASKTPKAIAKMQRSLMGRKCPHLSEQCRERFKGKRKSDEARRRMAEARVAYMASRPYVYGAQTSLERTVDALLLALGVPYERQKRIATFVVDFYVPSKRLVIECDGEYWHSRPAQREKDRARDEKLRRLNYSVLRLPESHIKSGQAADLLRAAV